MQSSAVHDHCDGNKVLLERRITVVKTSKKISRLRE